MRPYTISIITLLHTGGTCLFSYISTWLEQDRLILMFWPLHKSRSYTLALLMLFTPRNKYKLSVLYHLIYDVNYWWNEQKIKLLTAKLQMKRLSRSYIFFINFDLQIWSWKIGPGTNYVIKENVKISKIIIGKSLIWTKTDQWIKSYKIYFPKKELVLLTIMLIK